MKELTRKTAEEVSEGGGGALAVRVDVSKEAEVSGMVGEATGRFGWQDVLFDDAAVALIRRNNRVTEIAEETWDRALAVNIKRAYLGCKHAIPAMIESGGGSVVNNASTTVLMAEPDLDAYTVAKKGRCAGTDAFCGGRVRRRGHSVQYGLPGTRAHADGRWRRRRRAGTFRAGDPLVRGRARRRRAPRLLPGLRRVTLRHRGDVRDRRRVHGASSRCGSPHRDHQKGCCRWTR